MRKMRKKDWRDVAIERSEEASRYYEEVLALREVVKFLMEEVEELRKNSKADHSLIQELLEETP